ncbi:MAG: radical SAM protein [Gammaproteobacteria bacterium]|nr:radical SAM protein [Gammaproteobacteria bacterium]
MMKKLFLLSPPYVKDYMRNARCDFVSNSGSQWYPLWLGYCGALLESRGYEVTFIDAPAAGYDFAETERIFLQQKPDLLLIYSGQLSEESDCRFADRLLRQHRCEAIFVGPFFSINPEQTLGLSQEVRYGVSGEFEFPVLDFVEGGDPATIANFVVKDGEAVQRVAERPYLSGEELDTLPFVSDFFNRHLDLKWYRTPSEKFPYIDIMSGRGCCWGQCTYCLWVFSFIKGHTYNLRSLDNLLDEVAFIEEKMPHIRSLMIQDDTFPSGRAKEFAEGKMARGLQLPWSCYSRGNIDLEILQKMKQSGCLNLHVGFESGNPEILKNIKKGVDKERMTRFAHDAKAAGVHLHGDFAIGFPGESAQSIRETIDWACEIRPDTAQFQLMIPFPGTPMFDELKEKGWLKNGAPDFPELDWEEMERYAKQAYREFYLSWPYAKEVMKHPYELGVKKVNTYISAVPSIFWKRWTVR